MIPVYRSTITRLDLSSVLKFMVEDFLGNAAVEDALAKECAERMSCDAALCLRSVSDALRLACRIAAISEEAKPDSKSKGDATNTKHAQHTDAKKTGRQAVFLPALAPAVLYAELAQSAGIDPVVYDVHPDLCSEPAVHELKRIAEVKQNCAQSVFVRIAHFGLYTARTFAQDKSSHRSVTVDISTTPMVFDDPAADAQTGAQTDAQQDAQNEADEGADITIIDCGQNTFFTTGGGAVLCVRGRKLARALREARAWEMPLQNMNISLALAQLKQIDTFAERTKKISQTLLGALKQSRHSLAPACFHAKTFLQTLPVFVQSRKKEMISFAHKQGVECAEAFSDSLVARMHAPDAAAGAFLRSFAADLSAGLSAEKFAEQYPGAQAHFSHTACFPLYPSLDNEEAMHVAKVLAALP